MNNVPLVPQSAPNHLPRAGGDFAVPAFGNAALVPEAQESIIRHYWRMFFRRRYIIAAIAAFCVAIGILIAALTQRQYAATTTIQVAREAAKVLNIEGVEQEASASVYSDEFYQTQYALLKSRSLSEAVVRELKLADNYLFLASFDPDDVGEMKALPREQRFSKATGIVNKNLVVEPVRLSSIINVRYNSPNPSMAATIANSVAENFVQSNLTRRFEAAAYARQFLQNRLTQVRARLEESERKAVAYAQQQGLIKIRTGGGDAATEQSLIANDLSELSSQLAQARAQRAQAEAQYRSGTGGSIAAQSLNNSTVNELRQQRAVLLGQLSKLQSDFGPEYPAVAALRAQLGELDRQINREQGRVGSSVTQDLAGRYQQALSTERSLQSRLDRLKAELLDEQGRSIQFNIIQRDVDTNRALYEALLQRFKEVGVAGGIGTNNISIVDQALPPTAPYKPRLALNILVGLVAGLLLGGAVAYILEQLDEAAILPADFQRKLGVPLLGSTPKLEGTGHVHEALLASKSTLSEAYFSILTSIQFSTAHGAPTTLLLTSAQAGEGKSTTSLALANALASVGRRVLLIDADMRNPSLHKSLGRANAAGLSNLLTGHGQLGNVMQDTVTPNLSVVLAGQVPPNPAELLSTGAMEAVIREASSMFDHVVIDGPPILGLADAPLLARAVEATVLVLESGRTRATQAKHAIGRLIAVRANVIGAILTKLDIASSGYGYGYGYDYAYGN